VWTEITGTWLGIAPHPEWSWWAIRGQLVESPGYMCNYAVGAVLATSIRASLRASLGSWTSGSLRWYPWVRDRVFRFGLQQPSREVIHELLGRAPTADPLLAEISRAARVG
jgi:Zn-dependent M32 family carboxypeptidase